MKLSDAIAVHVGGLAATAVYLGTNLIWEPVTEVPSGPPVTSGLLWHTDTPITFTETGSHIPAISMPRAAGPLYIIINYNQSVTSDDEPAIFYVGNPSDNLYTTNTFHVYRNWGTGIGVLTTPGRGMLVGLNQPPTNFIGEIWASSSGSNMVDYVTPATSWYMDPIPNHNPAATSHLFIGYKPDGSNAAWRGAGTINKMAIYDRVPTPAERSELTTWVQS